MTRYQKTVATTFLIFFPGGIAATIWFHVAWASSGGVAVGGAIGILVIAFAISQAVLTIPIRRRVAAAVERQNADALDAALDDAAAMWPNHAKTRTLVECDRVVALMFRERWEEAAAKTRLLLAGPLAQTQEALLLNNLAWALAHSGSLEEAATTGERALAVAQTTPMRSFVNGTVGAIHALQGDARALEHLDAAEELLAGGNATRATRHYYRGVALQSKGLAADAVEAFEAACAAAPASLFGRRAAAHLRDRQGR